MKDKKIYIRKCIKILYLLLFLCAFSIFAIIHFTKDDSNVEYLGMASYRIDSEWTLDTEGKKTVDLQKLGSYMDESTGTLSIFYRLPEMSKDMSLVYRSKDVTTKILIGENSIYQTNVMQSPLYNRSPGNLWNVVNVETENSGKILEMQIDMVYDTKAVTVDNVCFGDESIIILNIIRNKIPGIIISVLMLLLGFGMIVVNVITQRIVKKNYGLAYLGLYAVLIGIWSLIETNVMQFFIKDMRVLQTMDNMIVIIGVMPLLLYLDCEYRILDNIFIEIFFICDLIFIGYCLVMQFTGIMDLHHVLPFALLFLAVCAAVLLIWVILEYIHQRKQKRYTEYFLLKLIGIASLWIATGFELIRHLWVDVDDRAAWLRVGMLSFILCFAASNLLTTYRLLEQGLKFDLVRNLAYMDGLTGVGNRTAYLEQLERYAAEKTQQLGIVFMDINDLKVVNDTRGHDLGDELIKTAANIINESFGKAGKVYRIGGDEFCALLTGSDTSRIYEEASKVFEKQIDESNCKNEYHLNVQIAKGFAYCDDVTMDKIEQAISLADAAMYSDKARKKGLSA